MDVSEADETFEKVGPAPAKIPDHAKLVNELTTTHQFATLEDSDEILLLAGGVYRPGAEAIVRRLVESKYRSTGGSARHQLVNEVLHGIRRRTYVPRDKFNPSGKLCLKNGILDLGSLEVVPYAMSDLFTMQVPVAYDPKAECPRWLEFVEDIHPEPPPRAEDRDAELIENWVDEVVSAFCRRHRAFDHWRLGVKPQNDLFPGT